MEQLKKFWGFMGDHGWSIVSLLASCGAGAWFFSLIGQIADMYIDYPVPLSAACAFAFVFGFVVCNLLGVRDKMLRRYDRKLEAERAAKEAEEKSTREKARRVERFMKESMATKMFVTCMVDHGHVDLPESAMDSALWLEEYGVVEQRSDKMRFYPRDWVMELFEERPDLLDYPRAYLLGEEE